MKSEICLIVLRHADSRDVIVTVIATVSATSTQETGWVGWQRLAFTSGWPGDDSHSSAGIPPSGHRHNGMRETIFITVPLKGKFRHTRTRAKHEQKHMWLDAQGEVSSSGP